LGDAFLLGQLCSHREKVPDERLVSGFQLVVGWDMFVGDDLDVHRSDGVNIGKGSHLLVVIDMRAGDFSGNDFTEDAVRHCTSWKHVVVLKELAQASA
jgi:hypothetical protein